MSIIAIVAYAEVRRLMGHVISTACLLLSTIATFAQQSGTVPKQFRGTWAGSRSQCGTTSDSSLAIYADRVVFYASRGPVVAVKVASDLEIEVELLLSGEGETWVDKSRFTLSNNGRTLTITRTEPSRSSYARVRC
jgi:hypothetical protein